MKKTLFFAIIIMVSGCKSINPSVMFKMDSQDQYRADQTLAVYEYRIAPNDIIGVSVYANEGFKLIDLTVTPSSVSSTAQGGLQQVSVHYIVDNEGYVKFPIIGRKKVSDLTIRQAEDLLEKEYAEFYNKPFVMLDVLNRRVMVFPGSGGAGKVVTLTNENTTLIEALALAGGITETGKAYKIKLIRGDSRNPQVQMIDLSTIEGMRQSNLLLQANDIIYVEPVPRISQQILAQITPIVGILTSFLLIYDIVANRTK
ncbi:MAG: polysaccharide biosynthesis/export family protein [Bacteroidia bacterium]|nr:polysaccharide biosynthesis/export family protein [Bacteroidia bacterium]MCZ2276781.1 polysaccharide biosynthesis/export family protein [Bacteroidia bacterium]